MPRIASVLFVDDDPDIRRIGEVCLRGAFAVRVAGSGLEAVAAIEQACPDVVILDVVMPGLDGPATLDRIRSLPSARAVPVIFLTAMLAPHDVARLYAMGAVAVVAKPFDPLSLPRMVRDLLDGKIDR